MNRKESAKINHFSAIQCEMTLHWNAAGKARIISLNISSVLAIIHVVYNFMNTASKSTFGWKCNWKPISDLYHYKSLL